jgi:hypothetical protein
MVKRHLTLTWLILAALLLPSTALGALRGHGSTPDAPRTTQGEAKPNPQVPETLTWRQRTAEEGAPGDADRAEAALTRTVDAFRTGTPPSIDGDLADWPALPPLVLDRDTAEAVFRVVPAPADSSAELRALWTSYDLYLAVHVRDDVIVNDSGDVWRDDEIELAFDAAHDLMSGGPDDHQFTTNADGRVTDGGAPIPPGTITVSVRPVAGGSDVEARLPIHALRSGLLFAGQRLGFTLGLHDDDDGGDWDSYMIWEGTNTWSGAVGFGILRLVDAFAPFSWQQHTYHDWHGDARSDVMLATDILAPALIPVSIPRARPIVRWWRRWTSTATAMSTWPWGPTE